MINTEFKSIIELLEAFPTEQTCIEQLEMIRWGGNPVSPYDPTSQVYKCKNNLYRCKNTGKLFNVRTNTFFASSKVPLRKWFMAIWLIMNSKKGVSSYQLSRDLGVTQKTAWFMNHRIRETFKVENEGQVQDCVEIDETFVGGKNKNRHKDKKVEKCQGRSFKDKTPVFGMLQRNGAVIAKVVKDTTVPSLQPVLFQYVVEKSFLFTDGWNYGNEIDKKYITFQIDHSKHFYGCGVIHTNTIEGFWSIVKRGMIGIYNHVNKLHLQKYVNEYVTRYKIRKKSTFERFLLPLKNMDNTKIGWKQLILHSKCAA